MISQSILYGNGINRLSEDMPSWDQLIKEISDVELNEKIPNPLKYEALLMKKPFREPSQVLLTRDGKRLITSDGKVLKASGDFTEKVLKESIAERLRRFSSNKVYDIIAKMPVSHFITTNYDNSLFVNPSTLVVKSKHREEKVYSIRRHYVIDSPGTSERLYWPMHGSIDSPASIMLGFDHYCGYLAKIEEYVKGEYELQGVKIESMLKRLQPGITNILSWVDLFFVSNVHIIGINLGYEETDLWWVLNRRRRIKKAEPGLITNSLFYYPVEELSDDLKQLLTSFDVNVITLDKDTLSLPFISRYTEQLKSINHNIH